MTKKELVAQIETALTDIRTRYPRARGGIRIVWGYANREEEEEARVAESATYEITEGDETTIHATNWREAEALLTWLGRDYNLLIHSQGDPELPDLCSITTGLHDSYPVLPRANARDLYNVLQCCKSPVQLALVPDDDPDDSDPDIFVVGVKATLPVEAITGRTLHDVLSQCESSAALVYDCLRGKGDDHWAINLGE